MTEQSWYKHKTNFCSAEGRHFFTKKAYGSNATLMSESIPAPENELALAMLRSGKQYYINGILSEIVDDLI